MKKKSSLPRLERLKIKYSVYSESEKVWWLMLENGKLMSITSKEIADYFLSRKLKNPVDAHDKFIDKLCDAAVYLKK